MIFRRRSRGSGIYRASLRGLRIPKALGCAAAVLLFAASQAAAQSTLDKVEWFAEGGASFLSLGPQDGVFRFPETGFPAPVQGTVISPSHFTNAPAYFTGLRYHFTPRNAIEVSVSTSRNHFGIQLLGGGARTRSSFERVPDLSLNYVRYQGSVGGWKPFLVGGAGLQCTSSLITGWRRVGGSFDFGFGADHRIAKGLAFRMEVRDYLAKQHSPFHGYSDDISPTAGIVISSLPTAPVARKFPQIEFFLQGGASLFAGGRAPSYGTLVVHNAGGPNTTLTEFMTGSFSEAGRVSAGLRIGLTARNGLELEYSEAPNYYQARLSMTEPVSSQIPIAPFTLSVETYSADYVRYYGHSGGRRPFVLAGAGGAHFAAAGFGNDVDRFSWNIGAGLDFPLNQRLRLRFEMQDFMQRGAPMQAPYPLPPFEINSGGITSQFAPTCGLALRLW